MDVASFYRRWGGLKSIVCCVLPWKQGRLPFGLAVYSCRSVESVCVLACMMCLCVCVCVDRGGESPTDEDRQDKEEKKPVVEIKPQD